MLKPFRLLSPTTLTEASAELSQHGEQAKVFGGGAELVLLMRHGVIEPAYLVDVKRIPELHGVTEDGGVIRIGAATKHAMVERDPLIRDRLPALAQAAATIGNVRVRGQGTIGGNLVFADPHSDPAAPLLIHDATVRLWGAKGERRMSLDDFMVGTFEVAIGPDEILVDVEVPPLPDGFGQAFLRIERYHRPTVNVAAAARLQDGLVDDVRLAVGSVGARTIRLRELEARITGLSVADASRVVEEYRSSLGDLLEPIDDLLGSAVYKIHIASVLVSRALTQTVQPVMAGV